MTFKEFFKADRFATNAGVELLEIEPGHAIARLVITSDHLNAGGRTQGGVYFTLGDFAMAAAGNAHGTLAFSVHDTISNFSGSGIGDTLIAEAKELSFHSRLASYQVDITNQEGELLAQMTGTLYRKDTPLPYTL